MHTYYAVVTIEREAVLYCGKSCGTAAVRLEPGTCFGRGFSNEGALVDARDWAKWFRERRMNDEIHSRCLRSKR